MPLFREQRVLQRMSLKTGQDASAWVPDGLTLTEGEFLLKAMLFILDHSNVVSLWCVV